ncbi:MAG: hypothetical protein CVU65_16815 [Deltaproteobacteria bacterium HGW-Deltaproteobacteria-22]|jgi:hypothetical protein|nr:MAG: hypothetical protein CVU65_16815 [Deltaproteobacteria bacterium HGW-Deltaproteobacteria-22]
MRNTHSLFAILLVVSALGSFACDNTKTEKSPHIALTVEEAAWFAPYHPTAVTKIVHTIPGDLLSELDTTMGNTTFLALYDVEKTLLGYARQIGDPLDCSSGKCKAIRFFLMFDTNLNYSAIFHPAGKSGDFYKGVEGDPEADVLFTTDDLEFMNALLLDPPAKLLEAESTAVIVDAVTTATFEPYWDVVVRQAAYTTYAVLHHMVTSRVLMQSQVVE